jgi:predicted nucleic acid-binding protein
MKYLVDSDWVVDYLIGKQQAIDLFSSVSQDGIAISLITFGEIYEGIYYGRDPQRSEAVFRQFLRSVDVLPLNRSIMQQFARIRGDLRRKGQIIGDPDIFIAVTAIYHNLTLLTRNRKHYGRIPALKVQFPAH